MLKNTFCHLPGIGLKTESRLWGDSILSWDDLLKKPATPACLKAYDLRDRIRGSFQHLDEDDPIFFSDSLPSSERWRMYPHFISSTAYIDIETNGLMGPGAYITTIALYDGSSIRSFVRGRNLDDFPEQISRYKVLVTYNGRCFDVPFIEAYFGIKLDHAHIDLRYVLYSLGFRGGLKGSEKQLGMDRGQLDGLDGYFAVLLWKDFLKTGDERSLETLLAYNIQDTINLEPLMVAAYNLKLKATPFLADLELSESTPPEIPFSPSNAAIGRVLSETRWRPGLA